MAVKEATAKMKAKIEKSLLGKLQGKFEKIYGEQIQAMNTSLEEAVESIQEHDQQLEDLKNESNDKFEQFSTRSFTRIDTHTTAHTHNRTLTLPHTHT